jgi:hypothetical protein
MLTRRPIHTYTSWQQGQVVRAASPYFRPPRPAAVREPGTNYLTIVSAEGPMPIVVGAPQVVPTYFQPG